MNRCGVFVIWCLLLVFCWPLAVLALLLYPLVWLLMLPFRLVGISVEAELALLRAVLMLPARLLAGKVGAIGPAGVTPCGAGARGR